MTGVQRGTDRLITKAAYRWAAAIRPDLGSPLTGKALQLAEAKLEAYAEVAADVVGCCQAPAGFELAIREAIRDLGGPGTGGASHGREKAQRLRAAWEAAVVDHVSKSLGLT